MQSTQLNIKRTTSIFLIIGMLMSFKLWVSERIFPLIPLIELPAIPHFISYLIFAIVLVLLILNLFVPKRILMVGALIFLLIMALQDQMRWQPWFYHYVLFLFPFCLKNEKQRTQYFQLILIVIYFWGGVHKFNSNFIGQVFPDMLESLIGIKLTSFKQLGYIVPITELSIAIGLLFRKTRKWAVYLAYITHILIIAYLCPLGRDFNSIIIPWNIAMVVFVYLCFQKVDFSLPLNKSWLTKDHYPKLFVVALVTCLPFLNYIDKWDDYLSFNLYSGNNELFHIAIEEGQIGKLDFDFSKTFIKIPGLEGGQIIDANQWSLQELNVPIPPEKRIFNGIARSFCKKDIPHEKIMFLELKMPIENANFTSYSCNDL